MSFLKSLERRVDALGASLPPAAKTLLNPDTLSNVELDIRKIQSEIGGHLSRLEQRLKSELVKNNKTESFSALKRQIRTNLAKWLYLSSLKKD